ncbi:MAG: cytochrome C oxidase subunit II [Chlorobi bacterium]|nr:cytochrome C oxidase subunit II [Chlorobiota bacterium]
MVDSTVVLNGQTIAYTIYAIVVLLFMAWFAMKITSDGKAGVLSNKLFATLVILLTILGVSLHITTSATIPWVTIDLNRDNITPDKTVEITVKDHQFILPSQEITAKVGELVLFDVKSEDLTYGFGIFREDNTMVCQMQVVPGHKNDLLWKFEKPGKYTVRSTEYSGPKGHKMILKDVIIVTE